MGTRPSLPVCSEYIHNCPAPRYVSSTCGSGFYWGLKGDDEEGTKDDAVQVDTSDEALAAPPEASKPKTPKKETKKGKQAKQPQATLGPKAKAKPKVQVNQNGENGVDTPTKPRGGMVRLAAAEKMMVLKPTGEPPQRPKLVQPELPDLGWPQERHHLLPQGGGRLRGLLLKRKARSSIHPQAVAGSLMRSMLWTGRFFELQPEQLVYWESEKTLSEPPRGVFPLKDIDGVQLRTRFITLHFSSSMKTGVRRRPRMQLRIQCANIAEADQWAAALRSAASAHLRSQLPAEWDVSAMMAANTPQVKLVAEVGLSEGWNMAIQRLIDHAYIFKRTKDRQNRELPVRLEVKNVIGVQNFAAWMKYTKARDNLSYALQNMNINNRESSQLKPQILTATHEDPIVHAALGEQATAANEHWLFHGTSKEGVQGIVNKDFKLDLAGTHRGTLYGKGLYLAECSTKADEYASEDDDGLCRMLVCRVALGRCFVEDAVKPNVSELVAKVKSGYDSLCGDRWTAVGTYREFVLFNQELVYPAYIVTYKRTKQVELLSAFGAAANRGDVEDAANLVLQAARLAQRHLDPVVRYRVCMLLGAQVALVAPVLVAALRDVRPSMRQTGAFMLGQLGSHTASAMMAAADRPDDPMRKTIASSAVPALTENLQDMSKEVRRAAVIALIQFGAHAASAVPGLVDRLGDQDEDERVREVAAKALGQLAAKLTHLVSDLPALAEILAKSLDDSNSDVRKAVATALGQIGCHAAPAVPALTLCLGDSHEEVRTACATALGTLPVASAIVAVPALIVCLKDASADARTAAATAIGHMGEHATEAVDALLECFQDDNRIVKKAAILAIGNMGENAAPAVRALANFVKDPLYESELRIAAANALGQLRQSAAPAVPVLRATLRDTNEELRKAGVSALGQIGVASVPCLPAITERIKDTNDDVRKAASVALATLGVHAASQLQALEEFSEDPNQDVRDAADAARRQIAYQMSLVDDGEGGDEGSEQFEYSESDAEDSDDDHDGEEDEGDDFFPLPGDKIELQHEIYAYLQKTGSKSAPVNKFPGRIMSVPVMLDVLEVSEERIRVRGTSTLKCYTGWVDFEDCRSHVLRRA